MDAPEPNVEQKNPYGRTLLWLLAIPRVFGVLLMVGGIVLLPVGAFHFFGASRAADPDQERFLAVFLAVFGLIAAAFGAFIRHAFGADTFRKDLAARGMGMEDLSDMKVTVGFRRRRPINTSEATPGIRRALKIVVAILLLAAVAASYGSWQFSKSASRATGEIISFESERVVSKGEGRSYTSYAPRVRFTAADGAVHEFTDRVGTSTPPPVGSLVRVAYLPFRPSSASIDTPWRIGVLPIFFSVATVFMLFFLWLATPSKSRSGPSAAEQWQPSLVSPGEPPAANPPPEPPPTDTPNAI